MFGINHTATARECIIQDGPAPGNPAEDAGARMGRWCVGGPAPVVA